MKEHAPFLPGLSPVGGNPVHVAGWQTVREQRRLQASIFS